MNIKLIKEKTKPTINHNHNYTDGEFYETKLCLLKRYGNANNRILEFKDENGIILIWQTTDKNINHYMIPIKKFVNIRFKIKYIYILHSGYCEINISHAKRLDVDLKKFKLLLSLTEISTINID